MPFILTQSCPENDIRYKNTSLTSWVMKNRAHRAPASVPYFHHLDGKPRHTVPIEKLWGLVWPTYFHSKLPISLIWFSFYNYHSVTPLLPGIAGCGRRREATEAVHKHERPLLMIEQCCVAQTSFPIHSVNAVYEYQISFSGSTQNNRHTVMEHLRWISLEVYGIRIAYPTFHQYCG